jgi:hypothetical protein
VLLSAKVPPVHVSVQVLVKVSAKSGEVHVGTQKPVLELKSEGTDGHRATQVLVVLSANSSTNVQDGMHLLLAISPYWFVG